MPGRVVQRYRSLGRLVECKCWQVWGNSLSGPQMLNKINALVQGPDFVYYLDHVQTVSQASPLKGCVYIAQVEDYQVEQDALDR